MKTLAFLSLNFNRLEYSQWALYHYLKLNKIPHYLTFVDNGSKDGTREWLQSLECNGQFWSQFPYIEPIFVYYDTNKMYCEPVNNFWKSLPSDVKYVGRILNDIIINDEPLRQLRKERVEKGVLNDLPKDNCIEEFIRLLDKVPEIGMVASGDGVNTIEVNKQHNPKRVLEYGNDTLIDVGIDGHFSIARRELIDIVGPIEPRGVMAPAFWYGYVMEKGYKVVCHPYVETHHIQLDPVLSLEFIPKYKKYGEVLHHHKIGTGGIYEIPDPFMYREVKIW